jgi:hypothetical protein
MLVLVGCKSNNTNLLNLSPAERFCSECASPRCNPYNDGCCGCPTQYSPCPLKQCVSDLLNNPHSYEADSFNNNNCTDLFFEIHPNINVSGGEIISQLTARYTPHHIEGYTIRKFVEHNADFSTENNFTIKWAFISKDAELMIAMLDKGLDPHFKNDVISKFAIQNNETDLILYLAKSGINVYGFNFSMPISFVPIPQEKVISCAENEFLIHLVDKQCDEYDPTINGYNITCHNTSEYNRCIT